MKILTWNLRHGGGSKRMPEITLSLLEHRADVVVLTEWRKHTGGQIRGILADHGLRHQHDTDPGKNSNGVLVASRHPMQVSGGDDGFMGLGSLVPDGLATHRRAQKRRMVEAWIAELDVTVIGVHIPPDGMDGTPSAGREAVFGAAVAAARLKRDGGCILIGDLNAGRHYLDEQGATFSCTRLLGELSAMGYEDAWRRMNSGGREYSWFSHEGKGFRIDHALVSRALASRVKACWYSHNEREQGLSDHSMMVLELAPAPVNS